MSEPASPKLSKSSSSKTDESIFQTPKKYPSFVEVDEKSTQRKVKSITKIIQKETTNALYPLLMGLWIIIAFGVIYFTAQTKMRKVEGECKKTIDDCQRDYVKNNCDAPLKGLIVFCRQKLICKNSSLEEMYSKRINFASMAGEIVYQFSNQSGLTGLLVGAVLIWLCLRSKGKEKSIISLEFYE